MIPSTAAQRLYVADLQRRLHLPDALLDNHCASAYGKPFRGLDRREVSALIEAMASWETLPADFLRAKGQIDLPGFGP